jgi:hypothetical protein
MDLREPSAAELAAIQAVWDWFIIRNRDRDVPWMEVVARVQERCPSTSVGVIRAEFERELRRAQRLL